MPRKPAHDAQEQQRIQAARHAAWDKENTRQISMKFNQRTDADILSRIDEANNIQGYIKSLIRADIESGGVLLQRFNEAHGESRNPKRLQRAPADADD